MPSPKPLPLDKYILHVLGCAQADTALRAALYALRDASTGYVACLSDPDTQVYEKQGASLFDVISTAVSAAVRAEQLLHEWERALGQRAPSGSGV